ncbi:MFS transporter [Blastococcus tunisiensis]|uniref:Nitrate/nitrite transporter NarK n=1 Tax=Blastococcus tunisiensis TaxID=1798228 RepID=A0A1I2DL51_9ACTN|nr:MFS transporter [Blastococcus sp. DSM 46838]SFE81382.1 Nitrate/nitrite transporter NarK [Blastococcus sp. DSM 46838]
MPSTARLVVSGAVANLAVGTLFGWSLVAPALMTDVGASDSSGSGVFALALVAFSAALLGVGRGLRRLGARRLLGVAAVLAGVGLGLTAAGRWAGVPWIGVGLLFGTANGLAYGTAVALAARVPGGRRGLASGLVVGAYAAGPVVLGLVAPRVLPAVGWRTGLAVLAVLVTGLVGLAAVLAPVDRAPARGSEQPERRVPVPFRSVVALWLLFAGGALPGLVVFSAAAPLASAAGLGAGAAGAAVSLLAAGNLAGRVGAGWWSDRVGRPAAVASTLVLSAVALGGLAVSTVPAVVLTGFAGIGLAYGGVSALVPAVTADRVGPRAFPTVYGRVFTAWGCAGLAAPLLVSQGAATASARPEVFLLLAAPLLVAVAALMSLTAEAGSRPGR